MAGRVILELLLCWLIVGAECFVRSTPIFSPNALAESQSQSQFESGRIRNGRVLVAELDKPVNAVLEAVMELGNNVVFLVPPRELEKRDSPDLGTGRSYSGQKTAHVLWGQVASNSPSGPGRRRRDLKQTYRDLNFKYPSDRGGLEFLTNFDSKE